MGFGLGWGANDGRNRTWTDGRPDAYFVDRSNLAFEAQSRSFTGEVWELKPIGWIHEPKYSQGVQQVNGYTTSSTRGCWATGSPSKLTGLLGPQDAFWGGNAYKIRYVPDQAVRGKTGLVFYTKTRMQRKPEPVEVPAPALSPEQDRKLKEQIQGIKGAGAGEGWSALQIAGFIVLIAAAIALAVAVAVIGVEAIIAAIIGAIVWAISAAASGLLTLARALSLVFGFGSSAMADAGRKGQEKESGLLDRTIAWFKSWF